MSWLACNFTYRPLRITAKTFQSQLSESIKYFTTDGQLNLPMSAQGCWWWAGNSEQTVEWTGGYRFDAIYRRCSRSRQYRPTGRAEKVALQSVADNSSTV